MNTLEIEKILTQNYVTRKYFIGCFASDKIPSTINVYPASMVIHLDRESNEGTHWIALFIINSTTIYIFDSLLISKLPSPIVNFISMFPKQIKNKTILQSPLSTTCGQHCIVFLYFISLGYTYEKYLKTILNF